MSNTAPGFHRKYDYDALKEAYLRGDAAERIAKQHGMAEKTLRAIASRNSWRRPERSYDVAGIRAGYEGALSQRAITKRYGLTWATVETMAKEHGWVRKSPIRDRAGQEDDMRLAYEAGASLAAMAKEFDYSIASIKSIVAANGWRRHADSYGDDADAEPPRCDPLGDALRKAGYAPHVAAPSSRFRGASPAWVR